MGIFNLGITAELEAVQVQLAATPPGSPESILLEQQAAVLENELAMEPLVPPIFGGFGRGGFGGGGGFGHGGGHRG
jgi:hypothetical protein